MLALPLDDPAFWPMAEHRLNGIPTLVGMGVPALIAAAAGTGASLHDLVWRRPIRAAAGTDASLTIAEDGAARVATRDAGGEWVTCAEARLSTDAMAPAAPVDLATDGLIRLALSPFTGTEGLMTISRRWDCRRAVWMASDRSRAVARLAIPDDMAGDLAIWPWHPALLDVAASLLIGPGEVPRGCDAIHFHHPLPQVVIARIHRTGPGRADLVLADETGRVCVRMDGLRFVTLAAGPGAPEILAPVWTPDRATRPAAAMLPVGTRVISDAAELDGLPADAPLVVRAPPAPMPPAMWPCCCARPWRPRSPADRRHRPWRRADRRPRRRSRSGGRGRCGDGGGA
ncbi:polyketide synthase dehydratase domain-containing protein [Tistrella bauzanensis]